MNMRQVFAVYVLPQLLRTAEQTGVLDGLLSISLYGSANYQPYESKLQPRNPKAGERDYDIWIVFRQGHQEEAKNFATKLFGINFNLLPDYLACILYDKIRMQTDIGELLLAPMIVTEECTSYSKTIHPCQKETFGSPGIDRKQEAAHQKYPSVPRTFRGRNSI